MGTLIKFGCLGIIVLVVLVAALAAVAVDQLRPHTCPLVGIFC